MLVHGFTKSCAEIVVVPCDEQSAFHCHSIITITIISLKETLCCIIKDTVFMFDYNIVMNVSAPWTYTIVVSKVDFVDGRLMPLILVDALHYTNIMFFLIEVFAQNVSHHLFIDDDRRWYIVVQQ